MTLTGVRNRSSFSKWHARLPNPPLSDGIPKRIHQTANSKDLPPHLERAVQNACAKNPEWIHTLYDQDDRADFIGKHYGREVLSSYERINPAYGAARADLFRYLVLYILGGVYADIKTDFMVPLSETIREDDQFIVSSWDNGPAGTHPNFGKHPDLEGLGRDEMQQWFLVSAAGHPFLKATIAQVLANIDTYNAFLVGTGKMGVVRTTGPIAYTRAVTPLLGLHSHREVMSEKEVGLGYSITDGYNHEASFPAHYSKQSAPVVL